MKTRFQKNISVTLLLMFVISVFLLCGCGASQSAEKDDRLHIVCTTFPLYDWTRQVLAGQEEWAEISLLMDGGTDIHNYQPTAEDILMISEADIVIYVGGESDRWMRDVIAAVPEEKREGQQYLNLMEILDSALREEEYVEGMEAEEEEVTDIGADESAHMEFDEHIWLSLKNAAVCVQAIETAAASAGEETMQHAVTENAEQYIGELEALDQEYEQMVQAAPWKTVLVADRFPFLYLMKDYGISYYAAFQGCSAETDASFETVIFLAGKMDEYDLPAVLVIENGNDRIAETVIENTASRDQKILILNSLQSVTAGEIAQGVTYLSVMQDNFSVLKEALYGVKE
ncbi:MAG: metal ABC transporter substrate-binding protein [Lachnospiraceae bacterium]